MLVCPLCGAEVCIEDVVPNTITTESPLFVAA